MSHFKNEWAKAELLLELPYKKNMQEEEEPHWSQTNINTVLYGGPVFNEEAKDYNRCFHYSRDVEKFALPELIKPGLEYIPIIRGNIQYFEQVQHAIGRIAVYDKDGDPSPCTFLTGFFITSTKFVTRTHHFTTTAAGKITCVSEASELSIMICSKLWNPAQLVYYDRDLDLAIFELINDVQVESFIPVSKLYGGLIKNGDIIAAIGYNGILREEQLKEYTTRMMRNKQPKGLESQLNLGIVNYLLAAERKSIAPGLVVNQESDMIAISCTGSDSSSGSPLFLMQENALEPVIAGWVFGGEMRYNFNKATRFTHAIIQLLEKHTSPK